MFLPGPALPVAPTLDLVDRCGGPPRPAPDVRVARDTWQGIAPPEAVAIDSDLAMIRTRRMIREEAAAQLRAEREKDGY